MADRFRRSAREMFTKCQHRYREQYINGVDMGNDDTRRGSLFHRARELYVLSLFSSKQESNADLAAAAWSMACLEMPIPTEARARAAELFTRWSERYELDRPTFYAVETKLECFGTTLQFDEVRVFGETLRVIDAKTFWRMPTEEAIRASFQAKFYLAAARTLFPGFARYEFQHEYPAYGVSSEPVSLSAAELDAFERELAEIDASARLAAVSNVYPATGGSQCGTCTLAQSCPSAAFIPALTDADAAHAAQRIAAMSRAITLYKEALDAYCEAHGPIQANGQEWAHREVTRTTYDAGRVLDTLHAHGIAYPLSVSESAVKGLTQSKKKYAHVADEIKALGVTKVKTEFGVKTVAGDDAPLPVDESAIPY